MKTWEILAELRNAIKENRPAFLWIDTDDRLDDPKYSTNPMWGIKAPIGGCGCLSRSKPRGPVVKIEALKNSWDRSYRVTAQYDNPQGLLSLATTPCSHGHVAC